MLSYFYDPSMFMYRWTSNFLEKVVLEREHGGRDAQMRCHLVYYIEAEFEQIVTKIRLSIRDNNYLQNKFH